MASHVNNDATVDGPREPAGIAVDSEKGVKDNSLKDSSYREKEVDGKPISASYSSQDEEQERPGKVRKIWLMAKPFAFPAFWVVMTGWWIAALNLNRHSIGGPTESWLVPLLLWLALTIRLVTLYVSTKFLTKPIAMIWMKAVYGPAHMIPQKLRTPLCGAGTIAVFLVGTFASDETADNTRANRAISLFGLAVFIFGFWATSTNRKAIKWQTVIVGMLAQYIVALFVLRTQAGYDIFNFIAFLATSLLGFSKEGTTFLFNADALTLGYFVLNVIPPIIFFVAFVQLLYYWGWLQWAISKFATIFFYAMGVSGAEAVVAAASPFVGQGESAMLIKPYIPHLTSAELHQVMTSGFATIAGSVLSAYIGMGISPLALVSSCVMSIPASLAISKLRYPETEESLTAGNAVMPKDDEERPANGLHAFANGSWLGIKIGGMIIAALLCVLSLLGLVNGLLGWWGRYINITDPDLSVELLVGYIFFPISFLLGVPRNGDIFRVAKLIGLKIVANEFVAYLKLSERSRLIATYAVCGFGNISSVGTQIGVLSSLAPGQSGRIAKVAVSALISGVMSTLTSASIAGMLIVDSEAYTRIS
ncbi:H+/nucleoside cotransporter [Drepanopeziza brunnea f. sp. 'multigermtubi' MB_m1]|uniref:H+/nucleoside cotransporter n=1 Tax=Marssonina brunnea f. sp. multigermtubi (strain MB_m1) TaxID=1072389 RepID=K1WUC1_MARBU|nr:H+/nucleoside cotransporter [Drepanopeziza brunnea f. sp. 'multigermtubi' MB_m1]EKD21260.1 H+/nucleoside cotransporter [Drepanopeziza brunnea f. sp. 'multigermtubi' MB_m1]